MITAIPTVAIAQEGGERSDAKDSTPHHKIEATISSEDVAWADHRAVEYLLRRQAPDGGWRDANSVTSYADDLTALAVYALYRSGVRPDDRRIDRALRRLLDQKEVEAVFARSYRLLLFSSIGKAFFKAAIEDDVHFLQLHQVKRGAWGSGVTSASSGKKKSSDVFHTRLALRALHEAAYAGVRVANNVWMSAERRLLNNQNEDGGWGYGLLADDQATVAGQVSFGSTTADALSALDLIYEHRYLNAELPFNGRFKAKCGEDIEKTRAIRQASQGALTWLKENFVADAVPGLKVAAFDHPIVTTVPYYLSGLNRANRLTGQKRLERREWRSAIASQLLRMQLADGSWARQAGSSGSVLDTCYALLALADMRAPLVLSKLEYGDASQWNLDPRDADHLTDWYGKQIQQPLSWQLVKLDRDKGDINSAPVLMINGHEAPQLTAEQEDRLRSFVHNGGTVLAVACCSRDAFTKGSEELFTRLFPHLESGPLDEAHEVWNILNDVKPNKECIGFDDGCRTSIFLLPGGACCAWHQDLRNSRPRRFALAGNILNYATFYRPLRTRWEADEFDPPTAGPTITKVATLQHGGDWWAEPGALPNLARILAAQNGVALTVLPPMTASHAADRGVDVLWLTGHRFGKLPVDDEVALKAYLETGGTLIVTACCGREAFDASFQPFAAEAFGQKEWVHIPTDDPLITGDFAKGLASSLHAMRLKQRYMGNAPPRIDWPIFYGLRLNDR
ncbi:MAG: DUF4159 domain-containing protein, partial [Planctomycetes bacterium]|nr:DUF4159 domain-containing protein [Planctomycetota bacterium]